MSHLTATIEGIGFWATGLPTWAAAKTFAQTGTEPTDAPSRPSPQLLAPNERRRAPESVAVALEVAVAACAAAGRDPKTLPSVFTSTQGDLGITDYMCATLRDEPRTISPTKFHNSVHNAAAGYWTIGNGCMAPATAISAYDASFAQGLLEALVQLAAGSDAVLLAGYDTPATGPLGGVARSTGLLGAALLLSSATTPQREGAIALRAELIDGEPESTRGLLAQRYAGNLMAPMLPLFDALATGDNTAMLKAGPNRVLRVTLAPAGAAR
ncbi:MAG: beta-ketoacyl synthase chain length factor [Pseudomonadota bacterium]|nr:beta-ketoacyl synthase chain length factor [Pseudomonadota bacterium]